MILQNRELPSHVLHYASIKKNTCDLPKSPSFVVIEHCSRKIVYDEADHGILYNCNRIRQTYHVVCRFDNIVKYYFIKNGTLSIPNESLKGISFKYFREHPIEEKKSDSCTYLKWMDVYEAVFFPSFETNRRVYGHDPVMIELTMSISSLQSGYFIRWYNGRVYTTEENELSHLPTTITLRTPFIPASKFPSIRISLFTRDKTKKHTPIEICIHKMDLVIGLEGASNSGVPPETTTNNIGDVMIEQKQTLRDILNDTLEIKQLFPDSTIVFVPHIKIPVDVNDLVLSSVMRSRGRNQEMLEQVSSYFKRCFVFPLSEYIQESMLEKGNDGSYDFNHYNVYGKAEIGKQLTSFLEDINEETRLL
jgi:hypothetical protein